jgi:hypothetical protein
MDLIKLFKNIVVVEERAVDNFPEGYQEMELRTIRFQDKITPTVDLRIRARYVEECKRLPQSQQCHLRLRGKVPIKEIGGRGQVSPASPE